MFLELPSLQMRAQAQATVRVYFKGTWRPGYITVSGTKGATACHALNHDHPWGRPPGACPRGNPNHNVPLPTFTMTMISIKRIFN